MYQNSTRPNIGDIYTKDTIPLDQSRNDIREINNQTINVIVCAIRDEVDTIENNKKYSIWSSLYGDFNKHSLRAHPPIKIRRRNPQRFAFNMNY
jgi:hypothetical protein